MKKESKMIMERLHGLRDYAGECYMKTVKELLKAKRLNNAVYIKVLRNNLKVWKQRMLYWDMKMKELGEE